MLLEALPQVLCHTPNTALGCAVSILNKVDMGFCPGTSAQGLRRGVTGSKKPLSIWLPDSGWDVEEETWLLQHEADGEQLGCHLGEESPSEPAVVET